MAYVRRALLTGYGPWGSHKNNPTMDVVNSYRSRNIGKIEIVTAELPVSFRGAGETIRDLIDRFGPDIVLELGLGPKRRKLKLERKAHNYQLAKSPDNDGYKPRGGRILQRGPDVHDSTMDMARVNEVLNEGGVPARLSNNAEGYVCNAAYYHTLDHLKGEGKAGLVHMPWTTKYEDQVDRKRGTPMKQREIEKAVSLILRNA